jgi:hypothetical protein
MLIPKDKLLGVEVWKNDEVKTKFFTYKMVYFLGGSKFMLFADYENNTRPLIQKEMIKSIYRMKFNHKTESYTKGEVLYSDSI